MMGLLAVFCSLQGFLPLGVNMSSLNLCNGVSQVTGHIKYALRSLLPLTSRAWPSEEGFREEVQAGGKAW